MFSNRVFPWLLNKGREVKSWESPSLQLFNGHVLGGFSQKLETSPSYLKSRLEEKCEKKAHPGVLQWKCKYRGQCVNIIPQDRGSQIPGLLSICIRIT